MRGKEKNMIAAYSYTESPTMSEDAPGHSEVRKTQQRQPWQGEDAPRIAAITRLDQSLRRSNVDVIYSYAVPAEGDQLIAVFKTQDDDRVMRTLLAGVGDEGSARRDYKWESGKDVPMILQKQTG